MRRGQVSFITRLSLLLFAVTLDYVASAQAQAIDLALAGQYFQEAKAASEQDGGKLWGKSVYGPMFFVDRQTRLLVANQADAEGKLTRQGDLFVGTFPIEENIANAAIKWAGVEWTMVAWPLPDDKQDRVRLMMHEQFHRIQNGLGLAGSNPANRHLDTRDGRIWLQMEWRALVNALMERGAARRKAIEDALIFRSYRRSLFPESASEERALEMNEGMAEYTGVKLSAKTSAEAAAIAVADLRGARRRPSFVRSFAYVSGPAYGQLLDEAQPGWRKGLSDKNDLGSLLQRAYAIKPAQASQSEAMKRIATYDGETLIAAETRRDTLRQQELARYRARFFEQPVLILPFTDDARYSFDPNNVVALDESATVYPTLRVSAAWGILEASKGALLVREGGRVVRVVVPLPKDLAARPLKGDGWTLELVEGWSLAPGERQTDMVLRKAN